MQYSKQLLVGVELIKINLYGKNSILIHFWWILPGSELLSERLVSEKGKKSCYDVQKWSEPNAYIKKKLI